MKQVIFALLFLTFPFLINGQYYEVKEVIFVNDELVDKYFSETQQKSVRWRGLGKMDVEQKMKSSVYRIERGENELRVWQVVGDRERGPMVLVQTEGTELFENIEQNGFLRFDMTEEEPVMVSGRYLALEEPQDGNTDDYNTLKEKYGDRVEAFVVRAVLSEQNPSEERLSVEKAFKVSEVALEINEDVVDFGKKYRDNFIAYSEGSLSAIEKAYLNSEFKIDINGKKITISSQNSEDSKFSFSSSIEPLKEDVYRAEIMKSFWDFYLEDAEGFELVKLEYSEFLILSDEDKKAPQYEKLKAEYGEKMPYQTIVQYVKEVPLE